jgi:CHAD domain-containing protein
LTALKVGRRKFLRRYGERTKARLEIAGKLPDRPTPEQIHDLRVTIRRIQVIKRLLPRHVRVSQGFRRFGLVLKGTLKATSQLRDLDTLMDTFELHKGEIPEQILVTLSNKRSDAAARATASAELITETPPHDFEPGTVRGKGTSRRLRKRIKKRSQIVTSLLRQVLRDETRVTELHTLRKEVKKLRYLLELVGGIPAELDVLTRWQNSLGTIRDLDVAIDYLRSSKVDFGNVIVRELDRSRHSKYANFVREYKTDSLESLGNSRVLVGLSASSVVSSHGDT